jgi:hypothetical protein
MQRNRGRAGQTHVIDDVKAGGIDIVALVVCYAVDCYRTQQPFGAVLFFDQQLSDQVLNLEVVF